MQRNIYSIRLDELNTSKSLKTALSTIPEDAVVVFEDIDSYQISQRRNTKSDDNSIDDSSSSEDNDELLVAEFDLHMIDEVRSTWQFFRDRRPETYGPITEL